MGSTRWAEMMHSTQQPPAGLEDYPDYERLDVEGSVAQGRQAYIICPLVEESEALEAKSAIKEFERLKRDVFPDLRLGLAHGQLRPAEKERVHFARARAAAPARASVPVVGGYRLVPWKFSSLV